MLRRSSLLCLLLALAIPTLAHARFDAPARAGEVAPFAGDYVIAFIHADLGSFDAAAVEAWWAATALPADLSWYEKLRQRARTRATLEVVSILINQIRAAGARDVYLVMPAAEMPALILPMREGANERSLLAAGNQLVGLAAQLGLPGADAMRVEIIDRAVVLARPDSMAAVKKARGVPPATLEEPLSAAGESAIRAVLMPGPEIRRGLGAILQPHAGEAAPDEGAGWFALGVSAPPKVNVVAVIGGMDAGWGGRCAALAQLGADMLKPFALHLPSVKVEDQRLVLSLEDAEVRKLVKWALTLRKTDDPPAPAPTSRPAMDQTRTAS